MSTGKFVAVLAFAGALIALGFLSVVALTIAGKPVSTVVYLMGGLTVTTIPGILAWSKIVDVQHDLRNGTGDLIAQKAANLTASKAAEVAATLAGSTLVAGGRRASDPPATLPVSTPTQDGAA